MSRLRRLKERQNRIKATSCGLALALAIGSAQGLGTYALFTDTENIASNLAISTGDVDVKVSEGQTITSIGQEIAFSITNEGTLNQNISLNIEDKEGLSQYLGKIGIYFYSDNNINTNISGIDSIELNKYMDLMNQNDGTLFVLSPGQTIEGAIDLDINNSIKENKEYKLNLKVKARQINRSNELQSDGFYDEEIQQNTVNINNKSSIILEDYNGGLWYDKNKIDINYNAPFSAKGLIEAIDELNGTGLDAKKGNIISVSGSGIFSEAKYKAETYSYSNEIEISNINTDLLKYRYGVGDHINIKFEYENGFIEFYRVEFRKDRLFVFFDSIEAKVTKISEQEFEAGNHLNVSTLQEGEELDESDIVEPSKENIQEIESGIVDSPTEEIEEPSKSEVVELPKIEEEVLPIQPDVLEQPTEEIQGVLPSQTDIIVERKEETDIEE